MAGFVHVGVVDAEAPPAVRLRDDDTVGEPCGVCNFSNDVSSFQLLYFLDDECLFLGGLLARFLLHGARVWTHG